MNSFIRRLAFPLASALIGIGTQGLVWAAPLSLSQVPAGAGGRDPAPNIIVSVDDSGSMGAVGIATLKAALTQTFSVNNLADDRVRLAWQSMNRCSGIPNNSASCANLNGMKPLSGTHRTNFMNWVGTLTASGGTPGHFMWDNAGRYLADTTLGINSPWAAIPGSQEAPVLSCRKSFQIFMTDGNWNSAAAFTNAHIDTSGPTGVRVVRSGNADGTSRTLPDGIVYDASAASTETRLYRDNAGSDTLSTLSDIAFHYWATDLQPGLTNNVKTSVPVKTTENFGIAANPANLGPYWNPRNDPASWQHMVSYTIGFDADGPTGPTRGADQWAGAPLWNAAAGHFGGDLPNLILGNETWATPFCDNNVTAAANPGGNLPCDGALGYSQRSDARKMDLWHAAFNSRGRFVPAPNAQALVDAFQVILSDIISQTAKALVSVSTNSSRLSANGYSYVGGFNSEDWSGRLSAYKIDPKTSVPSVTPQWTVSSSIDSTDTTVFSTQTRVVLTHNGTTGTAFRTATFTAAQKSLLNGNNADTDTVYNQRVDYIRGHRDLEESKVNGYLRNRSSRLGDIVNSNIWFAGKPLRMATDYAGHATFRQNATYANRTPTLYVGANDGMLHGFNANNGHELLAYVPRGAFKNLREYTSTSYNHKYFVDGHPFTGDADLGGALGWRTVLVSGLGAGGKGYFVLDVTNPANFSEANASSLVLKDNTEPSDADIGHIFAEPTVDDQTGNVSQQIVKLNNNRWAVIMGNGYNSANERPVLLIQYLDGTATLKTIVAHSTTGQTNGLSAPRTVDVNGDGRIDLVFAGDLKGNLWKFDLTSANDTAWGVANWTGPNLCSNSTGCVPLFVAKDPLGATQPITAAPMWMPHPYGGIQLLFGTGRDLEAGDRSNAQKQTIYAIWDKSTYMFSGTTVTASNIQNISTGRSALIAQTVTNTDASNGLVSTSNNPVAYSVTNVAAPRGWYFDLPYSMQRVLSNPMIFEGQKALIGSTIPAVGVVGESCELPQGSGKSYISIMNMISGAPSAVPVFGKIDTTEEATMSEFGSSEFTNITDFRNQKSTLINTDFFCQGSECPNTPLTSCTGADCNCSGPVCTCMGPDCTCTGPGCRKSPKDCGNIAPGLLDLCRAGLFGTRTDWRELR